MYERICNQFPVVTKHSDRYGIDAVDVHWYGILMDYELITALSIL